MSHQNRSKSTRRPGIDNPRPEDIKAAREASGLTQIKAAKLLSRSLDWWQSIEAPKDQVMHRRMDPLLWEVWLLLADGSDTAASARFAKMRQVRRAMIRG